MTVKLAPTGMVDNFIYGQIRLKDVLGIDRWLVTDRSTLRDFNPDAAELKALSSQCGYRVNRDSLVWKVCRDLQRA